MNVPLITTAGAYPHISADDYHGREICPSPSISSTGLKQLLATCPRKFWHGSTLNPDRPKRQDTKAFSVGTALHDALLLPNVFANNYHVVPEGFSRAKTKAMAAEIAEADAAEAAGKTILTSEQAMMVDAMAASVRSNKTAMAALSNGTPEMTLAWQDPETGVWLRARPDFLPHKRIAIPDLKTCADASHDAFSRAITTFGYHMSAALYMDGIKAIFGHYPQHWLHIAIEKEAPFITALYPLPGEDIERGRWLNRKAIRLFAQCLSADRWPGYADEPLEIGLTSWGRKQIDDSNDLVSSAMAEAAC